MDRLIVFLQPINLILSKTGRRVALGSTQESFRVPVAQVWVRDDPVHLPVEPITLTENLLRNDRAPKGERDRAGCIDGNVTGPDPIGTNHGMPIDRRGPCKNAVKVVRVLRGDGNSLSPSSRTTVVIRVMWCRAVIALSDLFSNSHRHVYRAIGKVDKVFGVGW